MLYIENISVTAFEYPIVYKSNVLNIARGIPKNKTSYNLYNQTRISYKEIYIGIVTLLPTYSRPWSKYTGEDRIFCWDTANESTLFRKHIKQKTRDNSIRGIV